MMFEGDQYPHSAAAAAAITSESLLTSLNSLSKKKRKCKNKRRFSDEQIRSLEIMFESETKLEPRKKLQLARELGLQPRQVAIWFQNRRARWKSKQLEREYGVLRANYDALASKFEASKKEKQALVLQLQKLNDLMQKSLEKRPDCGQAIAEDSNGDDQPDRGDDIKIEFEAKPSLKLERPELGVLSDDDSSIKAEEYFGLAEDPEQLLTMVEPADSSLTSPENWGSLDSEGGLLDESGSSNQWWDFWS